MQQTTGQYMFGQRFLGFKGFSLAGLTADRIQPGFRPINPKITKNATLLLFLAKAVVDII